MALVKNSINLLHDNLVPMDKWDKIYIWITQVAKYLLILAQVALIVTFLVHLFYDHKLDAMHDEIMAEVELLRNRRDEEKRVNIVTKSLNELETLQESQVSLAKLHEYVYRLIPPGINLRSFGITYKEVHLVGESSSYDYIKTLFDNVNNSTKIDKDSIVTSTNQKATGAIGFNLTFKFK